MAKEASLLLEVKAKVDDAVAGVKKITDQASGFDKVKMAAAGVGAAIGTELGLATHAAMEHETAVAKMSTTYRNVGLSAGDAKEAIDEVEATTRRTGQSTDDATEAYTKLVLKTKDSAAALEDLKVAEDLAAFSGTSVADASETLIKAQEGQTRGLKALGIATTDVNGKALSSEQIMKNVTAAVHGQADAYGDTAAGQMARFHQGLDQMQAKIGEALLPALKSVTGILAGLADVMANNQGVVSVLVPLLAGLAAVIVTITTAVRIWTAVQTALDIVLNANPIGLIVVAIAALVAAVVLAYQHIDGFRSAVNAVWSVLRGFGDWVGAHWKLIIDLLLGPVGILLTNFDKVISVVRTMIDWLGKIKDAASSAFGWLGKVGGALSHVPGLGGLSVAGAPPAPAGAMVTVAVYVAPGDDFPESVYRGLREYQRRHRRPELAGFLG